MQRINRLLGVVGILFFVFSLMACQAGPPQSGPAAPQVPGVTEDEIILGTHTPLTGPVAVYSVMANATKAYFDYINATEGGVYGRKITYLLEDDGYSPPKTVDVVRKLVEQDKVFAIVGGLGTPTHLQVVDYLQDEGVPDLFIGSGAIEFVKDPVARPTVFGGPAFNYVGEGLAMQGCSVLEEIEKGRHLW